MTLPISRPASAHIARRFWLHWVAANALGELVGLGLAAAVGLSLASVVQGTGGPPGLAVLMIAAGTLEGVVVGWAQWRLLRQPLPALTARSWVAATAAGALVAWTLGMLPSTMMEAAGPAAAGRAAAGSPPAISDALVYSLAALMGCALGPILGVPQWWVLRRHLPRAGGWVAANAAAWSLGMPIIFVGASSIGEAGPTAGSVLLALGTVTAAGAVVGAVHGLVLLRLLHPRFQRDTSADPVA